ncbi:retrovirus-related pol polyprotein from transposon tnt 1-94 [Lasius niger]|uniref:Retrovirus-related pol polyprotein from transposon tnt 1-94 n=1 Tax=Lasius niger TaxID=67767 RepID=A0A0J7KKS0_LASNI|nr:retrovirus-related pol polyprotein from transposon tnt 1-94 [Lasius niger]
MGTLEGFVDADWAGCPVDRRAYTRRIQVMNDNRGAQLLAQNHTFHVRSKHIDVRHHFVRDVLREGQLEIKCVPSNWMPADFLTKGLIKDKHYRCIDLVGIKELAKDRLGTTLEGQC